MGSAYLMNSGGARLNFRVIGGESAPITASENMIYVNTTTPISSWVFAFDQPTAEEGKVWFKVGTSSSYAFNALKRGTLMVYPLSCKQYISGSWVIKSPVIYQNGAWKDFALSMFLFGDVMNAITGGYTYTASGSGVGSIAYDTSSNGWARLRTNANAGSSGGGTWKTNNLIDLTGRTTLYVQAEKGTNNMVTRNLIVLNSSGTIVKQLTGCAMEGTSSLDISDLSGTYRVGIRFEASGGSTPYQRDWYIKRIWAE